MVKKGGHPVDEFVFEHFMTVGERTKSKQWNMHCKYCLADTQTIVHRDSHCLQHLAKTGDGYCFHAPKEVKEEAWRKLMMKGGIEIPEPPSDCDDDTAEIIVGEIAAGTSKKAKVSDKDAVVTKRGLDWFLEQAMMEAEKDQANVQMLRCRNSYLGAIIWY